MQYSNTLPCQCSFPTCPPSLTLWKDLIFSVSVCLSVSPSVFLLGFTHYSLSLTR